MPRTLPMTNPDETPVARMLLGLERGLLTAGLLLLTLWLMLYAESRTFQSVETRKFDSARLGAAAATELDAEASPAEPGSSRNAAFPEVLESGVFGRIEIPRLRISALIAEGIGSRELGRAVGHVPLSAYPGQPGNCALAGHRDSFLKGLGKVREDDIIRIATLRDTYTYRVEWGAVVESEEVGVLDPTDEPSLTLVTCYPFRAVGPAPDRFVVRATLVEQTH